MLRPLVGLVALVVLAGCIRTPDAPVQPALQAAPPEEAFRVALTGCVEGGGHTVYNADYGPFGKPQFAPPEWQPADVREDTGNPLFTQVHDPVRGPAHGYYHATVVCDAWSYDGATGTDWVSGHVGIRVEPPPFDPGGADRHYLISTLPFDHPTIPATLRALGVPANPGSGLVEERPSWHSELFDALNGTYKSWNEMEDLGPVEGFVVRLWFTVQVEERWRPVALDMTTSGTPHHLASDGGGRFTHQHIEDPPPEEGPLQNLLANTAGLGWAGFDRVLTLGPQPDVWLEHGFKHH